MLGSWIDIRLVVCSSKVFGVDVVCLGCVDEDAVWHHEVGPAQGVHAARVHAGRAPEVPVPVQDQPGAQPCIIAACSTNPRPAVTCRSPHKLRLGASGSSCMSSDCYPTESDCLTPGRLDLDHRGLPLLPAIQVPEHRAGWQRLPGALPGLPVCSIGITFGVLRSSQLITTVKPA